MTDPSHTEIHFAGGEKLTVDGTPAQVAEKLSPGSRTASGFNALGDYQVNRELITHLSPSYLSSWTGRA